MALLLLAAWITVLAAALCLVVLPFLLGRLVFSLAHLPSYWTHDTASFAVGLTLLKVRTFVYDFCVLFVLKVYECVCQSVLDGAGVLVHRSTEEEPSINYPEWSVD